MKKNLINQTNKLDKNSVIPVYYQLAKLLERDILQGNYKPGEVLPAENEFASRYGISRMTVRRAISELVMAGMVYTEKGKGTFVAKPKLDDVEFELNDFQREIPRKGMKTGIKLLEARIVRADDELSQKLEVPKNTKCIHFRLIVTANDEPLVYENKYIIFTKQNPILEQELKDPSLSNLAKLHADRLPTTSKRILHAAIVTDEEAAVLKVRPNTPVFLVKQTIYDNNKKPIGWGTSVYRGDRYKLTSYTGWGLD